MKSKPESGIKARRPDFPLFSQKSAGKLWLQMTAEKCFGTVSTDSQESLQQQGLISYFSRWFLAEEVVVVDFRGEEETWKLTRRTETNLAEAHFHSAARESGFILCEKASRVPA